MSKTIRHARRAVRSHVKPRETSIGVRAVIRDGQGRILVLRRSQTDDRRPGTWDLPGGLAEYGEDPTVAVMRETLEETGIVLQASALRLVNVTTKFGKDDKARGKNRDVYVIRLAFIAGWYGWLSGPVDHPGRPEVKLSFEHDDHQWVTPQEFEALDIRDPYKAVVRDALRYDSAGYVRGLSQGRTDGYFDNLPPCPECGKVSGHFIHKDGCSYGRRG